MAWLAAHTAHAAAAVTGRLSAVTMSTHARTRTARTSDVVDFVCAVARVHQQGGRQHDGIVVVRLRLHDERLDLAVGRRLRQYPLVQLVVHAVEDEVRANLRRDRGRKRGAV